MSSSSTRVDYLSSKLDSLLNTCADDQERVTFLARQYGNWIAKQQRFYRQCDDCMSEEFNMGPFGGWMDATDFHLVLSMIDTKLRGIQSRVA